MKKADKRFRIAASSLWMTSRAVVRRPYRAVSRLADRSRKKALRRRLLGGRVAGVLEGVTDGELRGWIWDVQSPFKSGTVCFVGRSGHKTAFKPTTRRDDASLAYGIDNARGFSVPLDLLAGLGPVISVNDELGRSLHGGTAISIGSAPSAAAHADASQWLFMHIPKTAGTSLRDALLQSKSPGTCLLVYPNWDLGVTYEECLELPARQLHRFEWIYGHYKTGLHRYAADGARYVTFIREPLCRLRSNIAHHAAAGTAFSVDGEAVQPSAFINEGLGEEFDNLMTRMLAGITPAEVGPGAVSELHVHQAIDNVQRHFAFVGRQEDIVADCKTLQKIAGLQAAVPKLANVTPSRRLYGSSEMDAIDWPAISHRNRFDLLLHERLLASGLTSRPLG